MIDWDRIAQLKADIGEDTFPELAPVFLAELQEAMSALSANPSPGAAEMHFIKGSALTLGFQDVSQQAAAAELGFRQDPNYRADLASLQSAFAAEHAEFLAGLDPP